MVPVSAGGSPTGGSTSYPDDLAFFTGTDPFQMRYICSAFSSTMGAVSGTFFCNAQIGYHFTPVPEPSALALMAAGAACWFTLRPNRPAMTRR
jgi:hypothetical protein